MEKTARPIKKGEYTFATGKRKTSVASVRLYQGTGEITVNEKTLKEYEAEIVSHFLEKYDNKVYYVAEKLGISKNKIYNMINQGLIKLEE